MRVLHGVLVLLFLAIIGCDGSTTQPEVTPAKIAEAKPAPNLKLKTEILFTARRTGVPSDLYLMKTFNPGFETNLTSSPTSAETTADWSPDGSQVVFASTRDGNLEIYTMDVDPNGKTSNVQRLTSNSYTDHLPVWSPDGKKIAWQCNVEKQHVSDPTKKQKDADICYMDLTAPTKKVIYLTNDPETWDMAPAWSPNSDQLIFSRQCIWWGRPLPTCTLQSSDLFTVGLIPATPTNQTKTDDRNEWWPDWSATGMVVFTNEENGPRDIFVADFSVLNDVAQRSQLTSGENAANPTWSPDGTQILFMKTIGDPWTFTEMWIMDASGLNPMNLKISFPANFAAFPRLRPQ